MGYPQTAVTLKLCSRRALAAEMSDIKVLFPWEPLNNFRSA